MIGYSALLLHRQREAGDEVDELVWVFGQVHICLVAAYFFNEALQYVERSVQPISRRAYRCFAGDDFNCSSCMASKRPIFDT